MNKNVFLKISSLSPVVLLACSDCATPFESRGSTGALFALFRKHVDEKHSGSAAQLPEASDANPQTSAAND